MAQFNRNLSLYIPVVQKWQATEQYFKNAFKSSFVGNVVRVDFVARNGGDPALADVLSAFVYLEWFYNEFSVNWQKVILANDPQMPAHFYHTVGRNYWILCENKKQRTVEQVAEEKKVALATQGVTIIDADGQNAKLIERLGKNLATINRLQCENDEVKSLNAKLESELKETKLNLDAKIMDLNEELGVLQGFIKCIRLLETETQCENDEVKSLNAKLDSELKETKLKLGAKIMDLNEELGVLEVKHIQEIHLRNDLYKNLDAGRTQILKLEAELEQANEDHVKDKSRLKKEITTLQTRLSAALSLHKLSQMDLEEARTKIAKPEQNAQEKNCEGSPQPNAKFKCNSCSTKVPFISGKETNADKKHLCHTCFVKTGAWLV